MKAIRLHAPGGPETLVYEDAPDPHPQAGEVLVRVHATAITPTEFAWQPTFQTLNGEPRPFPIILGHEFSGIIAALGPDVADFSVGDAFYGVNDWFGDGAQAEYCLARSVEIAPKPKSLSHREAAVVPISALTAWQGLFEHARLTEGNKVLVHGAAGGVGVFAVQLACWRGARVIGTAWTANLDFVRRLGAIEAIDYQTQRFEDVVQDVDVVFDTVGGETLKRSWAVVKPEGKIVSASHLTETATDPGVRDTFFLVRADRRQLVEIARLLDAGELRSFVAGVFPLAQATQAYARAAQGHLRGKIVLEVTKQK
jgi:NADPH:quinone reductase-like Zn-dependent oxidoreductase